MNVDTRFELQQAIVENQLVLHYQPIISVTDSALVAVEALVRWRHPTRGILPPSEFVPAAERIGLARELTQWVLREAILQAAVWKTDREPLSVSVNLSSDNLRDALFRGFLNTTLHAVGDPTLLIVEIPAATLTSPDQLASLGLTREKGIRVAIDDVIVPSALADVPADAVKIGRSLVSRLPTDGGAREAAAAIVGAAKALGRTVTAVGVEDDAIWGYVAALGCDSAQGYLISGPLANADLASWRQRR